MKKINFQELFTNFIWFFLGIGICVKSFHYKVWGASGPEGGFIPFIAGLILSGTSGFLLIKIIGGNSRREKLWENSFVRRRIIFSIITFCIMAFMMKLVGFLLTTAIILSFLLQLLESKSWIKTIILTTTLSFIFYLLFGRLFGIRLPKGFIYF